MKDMKWAEFQQQPAGTIFQHYVPGFVSPPEILGEVDVNNYPSACDSYVAAALLPWVACGTDITHQPGRFWRTYVLEPDKERFVVWDKDDCAEMVRWLVDPEIETRKMTPIDQAGFMQAINVAITKALLMPDSTPDAMAAALGQSVGALAVIARDDVDAGTILARVHAEAIKVIEKFGRAE